MIILFRPDKERRKGEWYMVRVNTHWVYPWVRGWLVKFNRSVRG